MTTKLYADDSLLLSFDGRAIARASFAGKPSVVLDRTAFYPEGGGQLGDRGVLEGGGFRLEVVDVQIDDAGTIHHVLASEAPAELEGASLQGAIDRARRRDFMSQHTGQHMLSAALLEVAKAETISSRLGAEVSTIDVPNPSLDEARLVEAEDVVNDAVLDDRPIHVLFPRPDEVASLGLRRPPKVTENVRVIDVEGFDRSPCGGTHCQRTGQVGPVRIVGTERYKGGTRITFLAGRRALLDYRAKDGVLRELARSFTCGPLDVPAAVGKLRTELKERMDLFGATRGELVTLLAARLHAESPVDPSGTTRIVAVREKDDASGLRALAGALAKRADVVAFAASRDPESGDWLVVVERGAGAAFDAGKWLKETAAKHGGRGGGRPERAEGRLAGSVDLAAVARG